MWMLRLCKPGQPTEQAQCTVRPLFNLPLLPGKAAAELDEYRAERSDERSQAKRHSRTSPGRGRPAHGKRPPNPDIEEADSSFSTLVSPVSCPATTTGGGRGVVIGLFVSCRLGSCRIGELLLLKEVGWVTSILQRVAVEVSLLLVFARDIMIAFPRRLSLEGGWEDAGQTDRTLRGYTQSRCVAPSH